MYEALGPADVQNNPPPPPPPPPPPAAKHSAVPTVRQRPSGQALPSSPATTTPAQSKGALRGEDSVDLMSTTSNVDTVNKVTSSKKNKKTKSKKEENTTTGASSSKKKKTGGTTKTGSKEDGDKKAPGEKKPKTWLIPVILVTIGLILIIFSIFLIIISI